MSLCGGQGGGWFPLPSNFLQQQLGVLQFNSNLPGDSTKSHRVRAQSLKTVLPTSGANQNPGFSPEHLLL